jgi:hypothetical protein
MAYTYKVKKGDTLNSIANQYGFANYKDAGVSSVPSGNFELVREGDTINLNNYDPNKITTIGSTVPVISSNDNTAEYNSLSNDLTTKLTSSQNVQGQGGAVDAQGNQLDANGNVVGKANPKDQPNGETQSSGNVLMDEYTKKITEGEAAATSWGEQQKQQIQSLLPQTLAAIDEQYSASTSNIENTYYKLIEEQKRLDKIDIDRTKAYGISGAQYMPLEFTNTVSTKEREAANHIASLENDRNTLLAQARAARDAGRIGALRTNLDDLNKIEEQMRQKVRDLLSDVQSRYNLTVKMREDAEKSHLEEVSKILQAATYKYLDAFKDAETNKDKDEIIKKILLDSGGKLTPNDYYTVYSSLAKSQADQEEAAMKTEKSKLDIENVKNTIANRNQNTAIAAAREKRLGTEGGGGEGFSDINALLDMADEKGVPYSDDNGFITPSGFKKLIANAKEDGINREDFLKEYGALLYEGENGDYAGYGLTQAEKNKLLGL